MKIGVWMDSPLHMKAETETTAFLMWSASARGHHLFVFDSHDFDGREPRVRAIPVKPLKTDLVHSYWEYVKSCLALAPVSMDLAELDVVWYRKNPPLDRERVETLVRHHRLPFTFNDFKGLLRAADKRSILDFPELTPKSRIVSDVAELRAYAADFAGKVVVKPLDGFGGWGIELHQAEALPRVRARGPFPVMVQEYLPDVEREGDVRILTLRGEIIGAMRRLPQAGEFRANVAQGGVVLKHDPTPLERNACQILAEPFRRRGLHFAGLDFVQGKLIEINCVSPGGIPRINRLNGNALQERVLDFIEAET